MGGASGRTARMHVLARLPPQPACSGGAPSFGAEAPLAAPTGAEAYAQQQEQQQQQQASGGGSGSGQRDAGWQDMSALRRALPPAALLEGGAGDGEDDDDEEEGGEEGGEEGEDDWSRRPDSSMMDPAELPLCSQYSAAGRCTRGDDCPLIHGDLCEVRALAGDGWGWQAGAEAGAGAGAGWGSGGRGCPGPAAACCALPAAGPRLNGAAAQRHSAAASRGRPRRPLPAAGAAAAADVPPLCHPPVQPRGGGGAPAAVRRTVHAAGGAQAQRCGGVQHLLRAGGWVGPAAPAALCSSPAALSTAPAALSAALLQLLQLSCSSCSSCSSLYSSCSSLCSSLQLSLQLSAALCSSLCSLPAPLLHLSLASQRAALLLPAPPCSPLRAPRAAAVTPGNAAAEGRRTCRCCARLLPQVMSKANPSERRFGLMACEHAFCLGCIRAWRSTSTADVDSVGCCRLLLPCAAVQALRT